MRLLNQIECEQINGAGWLKFVLPVVIGFVVAGPAGAVYATGTIIATAGVKNLEHLHGHNKVPTIENIING